MLHLADDNVIPGANIFGFPQLLATRLMPSVVPRTNTSSSAERGVNKPRRLLTFLHAFGRLRA